MKKLLIGVIGVSAVAATIAIADNVTWSGAGKPSSVTTTVVQTNGVEWTRRGSMGTKDYVVTDLDVFWLNPLKTVFLTQAQINKGISFDSAGNYENGAVEIGYNARGNLLQSDVSALNTSNAKVRNVGIAIGSYAHAEGSSTTKNQAIAIGYQAKAIGSCAMAIGPGNKHNDGTETDLTGHSAYANGSCALAIGYSAKALADQAVAIGAGASGDASTDKTEATAKKATAIGYCASSRAENAVQIGTGTNTVANTVQIGNITFTKNGALAMLDPQNVNGDEAMADETKSVMVTPYILNTFTLNTQAGPGSEVGIKSTGSRNYELYIENEENIRHGLPVNFDIDIDGAKLVYLTGSDQCKKLPIHIKIQQPTSKTVLISVTELDDGYDWTPVVTNSFIRYSTAQGKFYCEGNKRSIEGESLQNGTEFKIAYPIDASGTTVTNDFMVVSNGEIPGTYFDYAAQGDLVPVTAPYIDSSATVKLWYDVIYKTLNGEAIVKRFELTSVD